MCNKWQANGVKLLGAFDGNPAGHGIAMLYKFGVDNGIFQNELTAVSLKVVGLFPSDLQVNSLVQRCCCTALQAVNAFYCIVSARMLCICACCKRPNC